MPLLNIAQNSIVFRDMYLQCPTRNNNGKIKLSDFRLLSSMNRRLSIKRSDV